MTDEKEFLFILGRKTIIKKFTYGDLDTFKFDPNVKARLYQSNQYEIEVDIQQEVFEHFYDYITTGKLEGYNGNNITQFLKISEEIGTKYIQNTYKSLMEKFSKEDEILNTLIDQNCEQDDKKLIEQTISRNLSHHILENPQKLRQIPIASLFNIFSSPNRSLSNHDIAYDFITNSLKIDHNEDICVLISCLDGTVMSKEKVEDAFANKDNHNGYLPKIPNNFFSVLKDKTDDIYDKFSQIKTQLSESANYSKYDEIQKQFNKKIDQIKTEQENRFNEFLKQQKVQYDQITKEINSLNSKQSEFDKRLNDFESKQNKLEKEITTLKGKKDDHDLLSNLNDIKDKMATKSELNDVKSNFESEISKLKQKSQANQNRLDQLILDAELLKFDISNIKVQNQPNQNANPTQQTQSNKPIQPAQQNKPVQPIQQTKPIQPAQQTKPVQPIQQTKPIQPAQQTTNVKSTFISTIAKQLQGNMDKNSAKAPPTTQNQPNQNANPTQQTQSNKPIQPAQQNKPVQPIQQTKPIQPAQQTTNVKSTFISTIAKQLQGNMDKNSAKAPPTTQNQPNQSEFEKRKNSFRYQQHGSLNTSSNTPKIDVENNKRPASFSEHATQPKIKTIDSATVEQEFKINKSLSTLDFSDSNKFEEIVIYLKNPTEPKQNLLFTKELKSVSALNQKHPKNRLGLEIIQFIQRNIPQFDNFQYIKIGGFEEPLPASLFSFCDNIESIEFVQPFSIISPQLCKNCKNLRKVKFTSKYFGSNTKKIEILESAFSGCASLVEISFPSEIIKIEKKAFSNCSSLKSVIFQPDSNVDIEPEAFSLCTNLDNCILPLNTRSIGKLAFDGCNKLTKVFIPPQFIDTKQKKIDLGLISDDIKFLSKPK